jgi:hypothetical protein
MEIVYWTMKNGKHIDIDEMSIEHLRNTLKMIVRKKEKLSDFCPHNAQMAQDFADQEPTYHEDDYHFDSIYF